MSLNILMLVLDVIFVIKGKCLLFYCWHKKGEGGDGGIFSDGYEPDVFKADVWINTN